MFFLYPANDNDSVELFTKLNVIIGEFDLSKIDTFSQQGGSIKNDIKISEVTNSHP